MRVNGSLLCFLILFRFTWSSESGMSFFTRLANGYLTNFIDVVIYWSFLSDIHVSFLVQGMKVVFRVGLALLKNCHDDLVSYTSNFIV